MILQDIIILNIERSASDLVETMFATKGATKTIRAMLWRKYVKEYGEEIAAAAVMKDGWNWDTLNKLS